MTFIDGIGGAFLFSSDPRRLAAWYREMLEIEPDGEDAECGSIYKTYSYRDFDDPSRKKTTTWAILPAKGELAGAPRTGQINYRVKNMDELLARLRSKSVEIEETADYEYGKFAWVSDPDGNRVELFEEPPKVV